MYVNRLESVMFALKYVFYRPDNYSRGNPMTVNFEGLAIHK